MKRLFFSGLCLMVPLLLPGGAFAEKLISNSFQSDGEAVSTVTGKGTADSFESVSAGGQANPVGEVTSPTFKVDSGFAEILENACPGGVYTADNPNEIDSRIGDPCDIDDDDDDVADEAIDNLADLPGATSLLADNCPFNPNPGQEDQDTDDIGDICDPDVDGDLFRDKDDELNPVGDDNCPLDFNPGQEDFDNDGDGDVCDEDDDNDGILDIIEDPNENGVVEAGETNPLDTDTDDDGIDDGVEDANQNGVVDVDGVSGDPIESDPRDDDSDDDNLLDGQEDLNGNGTVDPGETSAIDDDSDDDLVQDDVDNCPVTSNNDQANFDLDAQGDACDLDDDNDGVNDTNEPDVLAEQNFDICGDADADLCDDCAVGTDNAGPLPDFDVNNDGLDTDTDGLCNVGDPDDDDDTIPDEFDGNSGPDNCPLDPNTDQADSDNDGIGDVCDPVDDNDQLCFPVSTPGGGLAIVCI